MIKVENIDIWGFEHAIRGMRNPLNSWVKSDSEPAFHALENFAANDPMAEKYRKWNDDYGLNVKIGPNDLDLMRKLFKAGPEHRKYLRQIFVSMDITAPLYWWKEADTYKVGTVSNSCSTMHKIHDKQFTTDDFSHENITEDVSCKAFLDILKALNFNRTMYLETKDKKWWWNMIQLLPSSYNQKRTITMNYENVITIIHQRSGHKLDEWNELIDIFKTLPYISRIMEPKLEEDKVNNNEPKVPYTAILKIK